MSILRLTDGTGRWFDDAKATTFDEGTRWDGSNNVSLASGSQFDHEQLYRTAGGVYVVHHWSQWQGSCDSVEEITREDAARWLSVNEHDEDDAAAIGAKDAYGELEVK